MANMEFMPGNNNNNRNRLWTSNSNSSNNNNNNNNNNNGFLLDHHQIQRPQTPGNLSIISSISGQIAAARTLPTAPRHTNISAGADKLSPYKPHYVGVQSRFRRQYLTRTLLIMLVVLVIILLIAVIVISIIHRKRDGAVCHSRECLRTAASLAYSMDATADPCEDFYQFTCGNWATEHPRPDAVTSNDWFRERQASVLRTLRDFLRTNRTDTEPTAVDKSKAMYRACMDTTLMNELELEPLVQMLRTFRLPLVPSVLNVTLSTASAKKYETDLQLQFDWLHTLVLIKRQLGLDVIFGFDVFPDPLNRTLNRIAFGTPETDSALPFNNDELHRLLRKKHKHMLVRDVDVQDDRDERDAEEDEEDEQQTESGAKQLHSGLAAYIAYVTKIVEFYLLYVDPDIQAEEVDDGITQLAQQAVKFARIIFKIKDEVENATKSKNPIDDIVYVSVVDLQNQTDKLIAPKTLPIWHRYLQLIMNGTQHAQPFGTTSLQIITSPADIAYLQAVVEYIQDVSPAMLEAYVWLTTVEELILHTTSDMRLLHAEYMRLAVGTEGSTPRSLYCTHGVNSLMGMAVSYALIDDDFTRSKLPRVHTMLQHIRSAFDQLVRATSWMDAPTKRETLRKSADMKSFIGYPEWLRNATMLDAHYEGVHVNVSQHLENMVSVLRWNMLVKLNNLNTPEPIGWATAPSNVNAFHTFQSNAITIPIAILQYPFYDLGMEALNYGSIGSILGHELTHGFDDSGRMFDKDGNMLEWWSNDTINEYVNRTECFISQYNHYYLNDIGEYIDGELTLGENIADNGGMREAYHAYHRYVRSMGKERLQLPGFEQYTHDQLFFISFGNLWCETYTPAASRYALEDSHCPGKIRLKGVLTNSLEFARTFNCPRGSGMNPSAKKCRIW